MDSKAKRVNNQAEAQAAAQSEYDIHDLTLLGLLAN